MFDPKHMQTPSDQATAEVRARLYALLAVVWRYPDDLLVAQLMESSAWDFDSEPVDRPEIREALRALRETRDRFRKRSTSQVLNELASAHTRLFGHAVRGTSPPYELEYGRGEIIQQTADLADLAGFYSAFGLSLAESAFERADHVCVQCEFMCVLCAKEVLGYQQGNLELVERCCDGQRLFLRDHLGRWLPAFTHRVAALDQDGFYGNAASLAAAFIVDECRIFDIEAGPQWLDLRLADPVRDVEIDCDSVACAEASGDRLVQIGFESSAGNSK